ncbi:endonuclease YncB(thermonuclease family) [Bradyrhizobium sp. USDA 326]|uniref:thermonuclease family protein n=1 Tax=Bradyrhizobium sp. USDA 326 TaxID=3377726 RepID=UPI003C73E73E
MKTLMTVLVLMLAFCSGSLRAEPITAAEIAVVDGDTIDAHGQRYRMIGYDTPEVATPRRKVRADERAVALLAKERLGELLHAGTLDLTEVPCSCSKSALINGTCNHRRKCAILSLDGNNIGATLIAEELAVPYVCSANRCPRMPNWKRILEQQMKAR